MESNVNEVTNELSKFAPGATRVFVKLAITGFLTFLLAMLLAEAYNGNLERRGEATKYAKLSPLAIGQTFLGLFLFTTAVGAVLLFVVKQTRSDDRHRASMRKPPAYTPVSDLE